MSERFDSGRGSERRRGGSLNRLAAGLIVAGGAMAAVFLFPVALLLALFGGSGAMVTPSPSESDLVKITETIQRLNRERGAWVDPDEVQAVLHVKLGGDWAGFTDHALTTVLQHWYEEYEAEVCEEVETDNGPEIECRMEQRWRARLVDDVVSLLKFSKEEQEWLFYVMDFRGDWGHVSDDDACAPPEWRPVLPRGWVWPVPGATRVTSCFGYRTDPKYGGLEFHTGLDVAATMGTILFAPASGRVTSVTSFGGCGNGVSIEHDGEISTRFCHLQEVWTVVGEEVFAGQMIGTIGSTGKSTGPHMHLEIKVAGEYVDPLLFLSGQ